MTEAPTLRVLVVDDTAVHRQILAAAVEAMPNTDLAGVAPSGAIALARLKDVNVDVVLLDIFMPDMNGIETLAEIRKAFPDISVIMVSGLTSRDADITVQALGMGAIDFVPKPATASPSESVTALCESLRPVLRVAEVRRLTRSAIRGRPRDGAAGPATPANAAAHRAPTPTRCDIVLIGVSTGGPNALQAVIPELPGDLPAPILIVQHMPPPFTASLAGHLDRRSALRVKEATEDEPVVPGTVFIAPGGLHMTVRQTPPPLPSLRIGLNDSPPVKSCRPSADVLFRSVAATSCTPLAVVLTGIGSDGTLGVEALKRRGCHCLAQDEETCVVFGMPKSVIDRGLANEVLPISRIHERIAALTRT